MLALIPYSHAFENIFCLLTEQNYTKFYIRTNLSFILIRPGFHKALAAAKVADRTNPAVSLELWIFLNPIRVVVFKDENKVSEITSMI